MTRVILSSGQPILEIGLRAIFNEAPGEFSLSVCTSPDGLMDRVLEENGNLVVVDMTGGVSLEMIRQLRKNTGGIPVILWLDGAATEFVSQALDSGVLGMLPKTASMAALVECLREVAQGRLWVDNSMSRQLLSTRRVHLTGRERQLSSLLAQGLKNKEIAYRLGITEGTVKVYLSRLYKKLGVNDRLDLALVTLKNLASTQNQASESLSALPAGVPFHMPASISLGEVRIQ